MVAVPGTRRSNGEGTEIKLGSDGRWHASLSFGLKSGGKRDRRHVSGTSRADVAAKIRELQTKRDAGVIPLAGAAPTLAVWLRHWLDTIAVTRIRPGTLDDYRLTVETRIIPALGHHRLDKLQPEHVEAFYAGSMRPPATKDPLTGATTAVKPLAASSVVKMHRILSRALKVAMQRERVARNVCALVEPPTAPHVEVEPLTQTEAQRIIAAAEAGRNAARWSVALALGLRQGEALGLLWDDVDLDAATLTVRRSLERRPYRHGCESTCSHTRAASCPMRVGGGLVLGEPKSRAGRRTIAIPAPLVAALRAHRVRQIEERLAAGQMWRDTRHVFATETGRPIDPTSDYRAWKQLLAAADVRDARLHDARHTAATLMLTQGVAPRVAMEVLGHSQIGLTMNTYSHVMPEVARDAADRVASALWGDGGTADRANGYRKGTGPTGGTGPVDAGDPGMAGLEVGAASGNRTPDNLITSEVLCRLS